MEKTPLAQEVQLQSIRALRTTRQFLKALAYDPPYYGRTNLISKYWTHWLTFTISLADDRDRPTAPLAQAVQAAGLITLKDEHKCSPVQHSVDITGNVPKACYKKIAALAVMRARWARHPKRSGFDAILQELKAKAAPQTNGIFR